MCVCEWQRLRVLPGWCPPTITRTDRTARHFMACAHTLRRRRHSSSHTFPSSVYAKCSRSRFFCLCNNQVTGAMPVFLVGNVEPFSRALDGGTCTQGACATHGHRDDTPHGSPHTGQIKQSERDQYDDDDEVRLESNDQHTRIQRNARRRMLAWALLFSTPGIR